MHRTSLFAAFGCAALALLGAATAHAQVPTVNPRGTAPAAPAPASNEPVIIQVPVQPDSGGVTPSGDDSGYYYVDGLEGGGGGDDSGFDDQGGIAGPVPPYHVVRRGDTLWDICWFYFNNPWEWPKVWSYNANITNPHWIYPGDLVRLYPGGLTPAAPTLEDGPADTNDEDPGFVQPTPVRRYGVKLRQLAFVEQDELELDAVIVGSVEEKSLLTTGDAVYVSYKDKPPMVGERFTVYTERQKVAHPDTSKTVGAYVKILGELVIESVKQGKLARARITDAVDVIERGSRVGPVQRSFRTVEPQRNQVDLQGTIVGILGSEQLIGQGEVVFVDKGSKDGVKTGNRMFVVRRGDAYDGGMGPSSNVGQDDRRFPARALGEIILVQVGERTSIAMVTLALQEFGIGDKVLMRKAE